MIWTDVLLSLYAIVVGSLTFAFIGYSLAIYDTWKDRRELEDMLQLRAIEIAQLKRQLQQAFQEQQRQSGT